MGLDVSARFETALQAALRHAPDAVVLTGDFCAHDPVAEVYARLEERLRRTGLPYLPLPGNHDARGLLRAACGLPGVGEEPVYGVWRVGERPLLYLDTSRGRVDSEQLDWLAGAVREYPQAPLFMHHPPLEMGVAFMDQKYPLEDPDLLREVLRAGGPRRIFCGHYHATCTVGWEGLQVYLCPPTSFFIRADAPDFELVDRPPGYLLLEWLDDGRFRCAAGH